MSCSTAKASISGNSVVPGLPNITVTPSCLSRSRKARFPDITGKFYSSLGFPDLQRAMRGNMRKVLVTCQHRQLMVNAQLGQQGTEGKTENRSKICSRPFQKGLS